MPSDRETYFPILVGAKKNFRDGMKFQRDDEGINISNLNPNFNELTAMYWALKNYASVDAIGLVHYRRFFTKGRGRSLTNVINKTDVEQMLKSADVIVPRKRRYYIETNYSHYVHAHKKAPLDATREVIKEKYPEYIKSFDRVMKRRSAHMFNMFIMRTGFFIKYANWLFSVLFEVQKRVDVSGYSQQEARAFGYISELLMDVWLEKNNVAYTESMWEQIGPKHTFRKVVSFISRKFSVGSKRTHF